MAPVSQRQRLAAAALAVSILVASHSIQKDPQKRRFWIHPINQQRSERGEFRVLQIASIVRRASDGDVPPPNLGAPPFHGSVWSKRESVGKIEKSSYDFIL